MAKEINDLENLTPVDVKRENTPEEDIKCENARLRSENKMLRTQYGVALKVNSALARQMVGQAEAFKSHGRTNTDI